MGLGDAGEPRQATLAHRAGMHAFAGKLNKALAELENVEPWNLASPRYISIRNRGMAEAKVKLQFPVLLRT
jgi:hypothetical protein